jgi:hypothetical protein
MMSSFSMGTHLKPATGTDGLPKACRSYAKCSQGFEEVHPRPRAVDNCEEIFVKTPSILSIPHFELDN